MLISNNRDDLQRYAANLISQLSNGEYSTPRQHQQMIDTARYCLQQLKLHARLTQHYRLQNNGGSIHYNNYSTFNSRREGRTPFSHLSSFNYAASSPYLHTDQTPLTPFERLHDALPPTPPVSSTSLSSSLTHDNFDFLLHANPNSVYSLSQTTNARGIPVKTLSNEPPPAYESLIHKSSSLPSYCNLADKVEKS